MVVPYSHESIRLTGRWKQCAECAMTTAPGAYLEFAFSGNMAVARFDTSINQTPYLHLWIQIDGGDMVEATLDRYIRIKTRTAGLHTCRIIFKGGLEQTGRWYAPLTGAVRFLGVQTEHPTHIPPDSRSVMEIIGDSITEGVLIDTDYCEENHAAYEMDSLNRPYQDDVCATWGWLTATALGYRPLIMGYGGVGIMHMGCGRVPPAPDSYPYFFDGNPLERLPIADIIVINHGANDRGCPADMYRTGYMHLLDEVRARSPKAEVFAVSAFCGSQKDTLEALIAEYNAGNKCHVHFINASEWIPPEPIHPHRDGHHIIAAHLTPLMRSILTDKQKNMMLNN